MSEETEKALEKLRKRFGEWRGPLPTLDDVRRARTETWSSATEKITKIREEKQKMAEAGETKKPDVAEPHIFTVMVFKLEPDSGGALKRDRVWGWYTTFARAEEAVTLNATDMFEANYYDHAVIEKVEEGLIPLSEERWFYRADYSKMRTKYDPTVSRIDCPPEFEKVYGFAMG